MPMLGQPCRSPSRDTALFGLFDDMQKFFLSGSSYDARIDYEGTLEYPGPELAASAQKNEIPATSTSSDDGRTLSIATFAGGCFWGMELAYQRVPGVVATMAGYTQGKEPFPTYDQVCAGNTGHTEAVIVYYDESECTYSTLVELFFDRVDPTTTDGQGKDYGRQYRTGVYYHTPEQESIAREYFAKELQKVPNRRIATELGKAMPFWPAEAYHQQYLEKGGRFGNPQSAAKGATEEIRCYG